MIGYTINNRSRYKCKFCDHATYKTAGGVENHLKTNHLMQYELAGKDAEIERLKNLKPRVEYRERVVYRDPPAPQKTTKYWYPANAEGIYCPTCKIVNRGAGIPTGQTLENTPHDPCNNRGLMLVLGIK